MANGDILSVDIHADGWYADIKIEGLGTGGTYNFNLGVNNNPLTSRVIFNFTSEGYTDAGVLSTISRTVYGTNYKRQAYPNEALADETVSGSDVIVRVALHEWIFSGCTVITAEIEAGFYTESGTPNNAASGFAVTNNSTQAYQKCVGNWSWPGYTRITGSSFTLRAVCFHRSGSLKRPVRVVKFTATDQHANSVDMFVTEPEIDASIPDQRDVIEYIATIPTTSLVQGDVIDCNFTAYPWVGDAASLLYTGDGVNSQPTPLYAPIHLLNDKNNTYGVTIAVVNSSTGNDATGAVVDESSFNPGSPPNKFLTIAKASDAIAAYNNTNHGRNDNGAGIIYLEAGNHAWVGAASSTTTPATWVTVMPFPVLIGLM